MNAAELLAAIKELFDESRKKQRKHKKQLKEILAGLKQKRKDLQKKLDNEKNAKARKNIRKEIDVICAQRRKGLKLLTSLKKD